MANATLAFLGLSLADYTAPPPAEWTPETLAIALRRLRALAGAQIRLRAGNPSLAAGKNAILCGRERAIGGGELLVEHVEWQVAHLHVLDGGDLFERVFAELVDIDVAGLPPPAVTAGATLEATDSGWPVRQELELVSADGASIRIAVADVRSDQPLARVVRDLMAAIDGAVAGAVPFRSAGPWIGPQIEACFAHTIRHALEQSLRLPAGSLADPAALERAIASLRTTNSGIERAQEAAARFLLGAAPGGQDVFVWHRHPGQPGARLRRLVDLATARPWRAG